MADMRPALGKIDRGAILEKLFTVARGKLALLRYVSLAPYDIATEEGRRDERYRRAALTSIGNLAELGSSVAGTAMAVALTIGYLGAAQFGLWMMITSFASLLSFMDLGVGNALVRTVAAAEAAHDRRQVRRTVTGGIALMTLFGLTAAVILLGVANVLPWATLFHLAPGDHEAELTAWRSTMMFAGLFGLSFMSNAVRKVYQGLQLSYIGHLTVTVANLLSIGALVIAAHFRASVEILLLLSFGITALAPLVLVPDLRARGLLAVRETRVAVRMAWRELLTAGGMFFVVQIGTLITYGSEATLIGLIGGPAVVALYVVAQRPFQFCSLPVKVLNAPLWAGYADARARGDHGFVAATLRAQTVMAVAWAVVGVSALALIHRPLVDIWTHHRIDVPPMLTLALAVWTIGEVIFVPIVIFMNGCGNVKPQMSATVFSLFTQYPLKILTLWTYGLTGMVAVTGFFTFFNAGLFYFVIFRRQIFAPLRDHVPCADLARA